MYRWTLDNSYTTFQVGQINCRYLKELLFTALAWLTFNTQHLNLRIGYIRYGKLESFVMYNTTLDSLSIMTSSQEITFVHVMISWRGTDVTKKYWQSNSELMEEWWNIWKDMQTSYCFTDITSSFLKNEIHFFLLPWSFYLYLMWVTTTIVIIYHFSY